MSDEMFMGTVKKLTEKNLSAGELIGIAEHFKRSSEPHYASQLYNLWIQFNADNPLCYAAYYNYAALLSEAGDVNNAKTALENAIALNPDFYPSYINLANVLERIGMVGQAVLQWTEVTNKLAVINGHNVHYKITALNQIARVLEMNRFDANAENVLRQSLEINCNQSDVIQHFIALRLGQCEWPIMDRWENIDSKTLKKQMGPLSISIYTDDPIYHLAGGWNYSRNFIGYPEEDMIDQQRVNKSTEKRRRRIGYVSSDLRHHAVGFIISEFLELHNRDEFEIFAYYCGIDGTDEIKERIQGAVEHWVDITKMDDKAAAQRIIEDEIEILVDVNGYTKDARTKVFALRPAPILVNWLGYPGSMGSPYHHYIIADDWIIPPEYEMYYSEKVVRLPCYQPNDRKRPIAPQTPSRSECGLPETGTVFCCFNGAQKISRFTFERWLEILRRVPDSVLWLLEGAESTNVRLKEYAERHGISGDRVIFAKKIQNAYHLARYPLADLFLDTSPYGAHVTASDALWMGVPILTFSGRCFASRVCSSLVRSAGIPEMVCDTPETYVERAVELGNNPAAIAAIKRKLAAAKNSCVLFDMDLLAKRMEGLYEQMWEDYCNDALPKPDLLNLEVYLNAASNIDHEAEEMLTATNYEEIYKNHLTRWHRYSTIPYDNRLWKNESDTSRQSTAKEPSISLVRDVGKFLRKKIV